MSWDLYQDVILEHNKSPSNYRDLSEYTHRCCGKNPSCGDKFEVKLLSEDETLEDIGFSGEGCSISRASLSIMTEMVKGLGEDEAIELAKYAFEYITTGEDPENRFDELSNISALGNIHNHMGRIRCATLGWQILTQGLQGKEDADIV